MKKVVVVIPTYNEAENVEEIIKRVLEQNKRVDYGYRIEVLVSDSDSSDQTGEIIKKLSSKDKRVHFLNVKKRGLGLGLWKGFEHAVDEEEADILMQIDGDLSHNPNDIPKFLEKINEGYNLVLGSRLIKGGANKLPFHRRIFSLGASLAGRYLMGLGDVHEFTASYRAFTRGVFNKLRRNSAVSERTDWTFLLVFLGEAAKLQGMRISEVPIVFIERERGKSKMKTPRFIFSFLLYALCYRFEKNQRFFKYALVGFASTFINYAVLEILSRIGFHPSLSAAIGAEASIVWNFLLNNLWTFADAKIAGLLKFIGKLFQFNLTSFGAIIIQAVVIGLATYLFGNTSLVRTVAFVFAIGFLVVPYNYFMYKKVIWRVSG